jgi:hypothetical protein
MAVRMGTDDGMGLEAVSALREHGDSQMGILYTEALDVERSARGEGATASVPGVPEELCRDITADEAGELVWSGGTALCHRSLATWGDLVATDGGVVTIVAGEAGTLFAMEAVGGRASGGNALLSVRQYGPSLVGQSRYPG